jgi:NAD(P)H-flavin reductase/hemoglobin-like flavoprotein
VSSGSGSGSGADQHLLALLRAIRLRQAAPDAVAAGAADTAAALTDPLTLGSGRPALPPGETREALPPGDQPPALGPRPGWAMSGHTDGGPDAGPADEVPGPIGDEAAPTGDFDRDTTADFFGRPKSAGPSPVPVAARPSRATGKPNPFDHGPQLRPSGLPSLDPHHQSGEHVEPATPGSGPVRATEGKTADTSAAGVTTKAAPLRGLAPEHATPHPAHPYAAPTGRTVASDGTDPADDARLRETQRLLSTSLTFAGGPGETAERLREALQQASPALLAALPGTPQTQIDQLTRGLTWLVHHLDQPPQLVTGCGLLGAALAECGVRPEQLQMVGAALAEAIRSGMPAGAWREDFDLAWRSSWQHAYEWIAHGETLVDYQPTVWTSVVVEHELRRHDLAVIRLRPYLPMPFRPGQYARVEVPELPGIWRPYSLAGRPRRDDLLELHVRAKTRTGVSGTLVYRSEVGDHVRLSRAEGAMGLPEEPGRNLLMIAGDTGVAPLKALLAELADTQDPRSAVLFWGVRNLDELYDIAAITEIARAARRATVVPVVSEGDPGPYASGLVTDAVAAYGEWSGHEVYLAGPPLMLAATSAALHLLGVAADHIHHDAPE